MSQNPHEFLTVFYSEPMFDKVLNTPLAMDPKCFDKILWSILLEHYRDPFDWEEITGLNKSQRKCKVEYEADLP